MDSLNDAPDINDDDWNADDDDDDDESSIPLDIIRSTTPILNRSSIKNKTLQRRQTIDTVQGRQHRTALQQLQSFLWPAREPHRTIIVDDQLDESEEISIATEKRTSNVRRSLSARENRKTIINDNSNDRRRRHRTQRLSDTVLIE